MVSPPSSGGCTKETVRMKIPGQVKLLLALHKLERNGAGADETEAFERVEKRLDPALRKRYHKLRKRKSTGIAVLENGVCSECRMIYPETHEMLRYEHCIYSCEYCGRFFIVTGRSEQAGS